MPRELTPEPEQDPSLQPPHLLSLVTAFGRKQSQPGWA